MPGEPSTTQSNACAIDTTLAALGFMRGDDGVLTAPSDSIVTLTPIGNFLEFRISVDGNAVTCVVSCVALKFSCVGGQR
jgi:hypothetical protein